MNQQDKIETLKIEIQQKQSELEKLMIETIKMYGGVIEPTPDKKYKAIESSGGSFLIEKFAVVDDAMVISGNFDGDIQELSTEGLYISELSEAMVMILSDHSRVVQENIKRLCDEFYQKHNESPQFAECKVMFLDGGDECDVNIKLSSDLDENDDDIFFYCNSAKELRFLTVEGCSDFIITDIYKLKRNL